MTHQLKTQKIYGRGSNAKAFTKIKKSSCSTRIKYPRIELMSNLCKGKASHSLNQKLLTLSFPLFPKQSLKNNLSSLQCHRKIIIRLWLIQCNHILKKLKKEKRRNWRNAKR